MNRIFDITKLLRGFLAAAAVCLSLVPPLSCGLTAPSPAAPPAPPAEIPAAPTFPESVNIGFGTPSEEPALNLVRPLVPIGGEFFEAIQFGFDVNAKANNALQSTLDALSDLNIPTSHTTTTFPESGAFVPATTGSFFGDGIKIDFADFAFPGKTEACTNCTCPTGCDTTCPVEAAEEDLRPICYRIWLNAAFDGVDDFQPFIAGYMSRLPTRDDPDTAEDETNAGRGAFTIRSEDAGEIDQGGAVYDHRVAARPFDKTTDLFSTTIIKATAENPSRAVVNLVSTTQKGLEGATNETQVAKLLRHVADQESTVGVTDPAHALNYIAQFREDADFWSGTLQNHLESTPLSILTEPPNTENFENECAQLSTAVGVEDGVCEDLGIDVTDVPLLELLPSNDPRINLPADFPAIPTF